MTKKTLIASSLARALYGVLALLAPKLLFGSVGIKQVGVDPQARYFNRLLGGRDLLVAGATLAAVRSGAHSAAVKANVACELTDTVALVEELRVRGRLDRTLAVGLVLNVGGYAAWLHALWARYSRRRK
ncbi:MAG: hypothetical protein ACR2OB_11470 [Solirubrobacteraceae bacterium]